MINKFYFQLFLTCICLQSSALDSWQEGDQKLRVIDSNGIFLRDSASTSSKKIISIPFGEYVTTIKSKAHRSELHGMRGYWINVSYSGHTGYVFDAYVTKYIPEYNKEFKKGDPQFFFEQNYYCGSKIYFDPDLIWFGVYPSRNENKYDIKRINITFDISAKHAGKFTDLGYWPEYLSININDTTKSVVLFGLSKGRPYNDIERFSLPVKYSPANYSDDYIENHYIYPGEAIELGNNWMVVCYGSVTEGSFKAFDEYNRIFENYRVQLEYSTNGEKRIQDLELNPNDSFDFIGDINGDLIADLIITESIGNYDTRTYLLMSDADNGLSKVSEISWGSCH